MQKLFALLFLVSSVAFANTEGKSNVSYSMAGFEGGFRWSSADLTGSTSNKSVIGYQLGATAVFDIANHFGIKTGLMYNERPFENEVPAPLGTVKGKITYFDVPAQLMFKFEDYAGVYLGTALSFKLSDESSPGKLTGLKSAVFPLIVGGQFKFAPNLGANVYFETVSGEVADGISSSRAVGANLLITFD